MNYFYFTLEFFGIGRGNSPVRIDSGRRPDHEAGEDRMVPEKSGKRSALSAAGCVFKNGRASGSKLTT